MAEAHKTTSPEAREPPKLGIWRRECGRFQEAFPVSNNDIIGHMAGVEPYLQLLRDYGGIPAGVRMVRFFRSPAGPGIAQMVVSRQLGEHAPLPRGEQAARGIPRFRHSRETWEMLWDEVEAEPKDFGIPWSDGSVEMRACLLFEVRKVR